MLLCVSFVHQSSQQPITTQHEASPKTNDLNRISGVIMPLLTSYPLTTYTIEEIHKNYCTRLAFYLANSVISILLVHINTLFNLQTNLGKKWTKRSNIARYAIASEYYVRCHSRFT